MVSIYLTMKATIFDTHGIIGDNGNKRICRFIKEKANVF